MVLWRIKNQNIEEYARAIVPCRMRIPRYTKLNIENWRNANVDTMSSNVQAWICASILDCAPS